eukprot:CAMPEP_0197637980 /NCGR_PEP_ID=MMETSP1338-20131121/13036_1 /TAXON_ID=43686 ORGANISM="Pelagodinium beii, Strain RCC1491" /NCGR_SAMPLE_ID=MMETSP1338 /ASSEMBLY_ACC=CAM_ASM_000754 /LENGTH=457 /DNA_ID=CAMNT_0043210479 /DNA_START=1 /DNA_END=1374 /DNA_ORIENTATION=-
MALDAGFGFVTSCLGSRVPRRAQVQTRAEPMELASSVINAMPASTDSTGIAIQFLIALLPAIVVEICVLEPVQKFFTDNGWRAEETDPKRFIVASDNTIKVQRPFTINEWNEHRKNPDRYWDTLSKTLTDSTMLNRLQGPLFVLNMLAAFNLFYTTYLVPQGYPALTLPILPFTLSSFALGLLITFRVNTASSRYVLARNKWGAMLNISRDLVHQGLLWAKDREQGLSFARWVPAYVTALMCHLRDPLTHDLRAELKEAAGPLDGAVGDGSGLTDEEIDEIINRPVGLNAPHYVLLRVREKSMKLGVGIAQRIQMETNVDKLFDDLGGCENIFATPIPLGYTKHTSRFLLLWLALLPFALEQQLGFGLVLAQQLLAFGLLGIEDIGIQLEEPFAVLPLKKIVMKICLEAQLVRKRTIPEQAEGNIASAEWEQLVMMNKILKTPAASKEKEKAGWFSS